MAAPDKIRIPYEDFEYGRFTNVGRSSSGQQFMTFVTGAEPQDWLTGKYPPEYLQANWARHKRWYAVLHLFDSEGNHLKTEVWSGGTTHDGQDEACNRADQQLRKMLDSLGEVRLCDIDVKTFGVEIDGYFFGLVYKMNSYDDPADPDGTYECVMLELNDIMFHPPWDSCEYST